MQLMPHQQRVLEQTKDFNRVAYYLDMGLGKTFVGGEKMFELGSRMNLLICQKSKIADWIDHFSNYYHVTIRDLTKKVELDDFISANKLLSDSEHHGVLYVGIINYDLIFRRSELLQVKNFTLMLDESSEIQNEANKRSKFVLRMQPKNVILLSGQPTGGKYEKLWLQIHLLGWNISKDLYWKQYIDTEWVEDGESGFFRKVITGYKNVDRLKTKLADHGAVFLKTEEVLDLPQQNYINIRVNTSKEYKRFMRKRIVTVQGKELVGDTSLTKRLYARMLCGQFNQDKLQAFKDLIESTNDRLIVFYNFNDELAAMLNLIEDRPISLINGAMKDLTAYEEDPNSITFIQYQAGSMGLNLQKANKVIYYTLPERSELFEQSKKRIHRIGQEKPCFYYFLLCRDSVEEDILHNLNMRKDYTDELFRNYEEKN